ncbi:MAG: hypothetical protein AVDCRST_MAG12-643 [uncultured Rubrobacteraceae bacterium]|uniref:DUF1772 domain-containing protein n=1 Tax=uncultured Rubrobacteraceae bacterium TaxID=349277 RepID=A0A6J4RF36_9ACTN|nr:MAG: hypothetical protein AVDCRST_MAG12-643 [uncultured Rubrobacteraceae bacterium]
MTTIRPLGRIMRNLTLACAVLTTGLMAGVFCAYAVSVNLGLAERPDGSYVATMNEINEKIQNPLFFPGFFGALVFPVATLVAHLPRRRSGRFRLIALACVLYVGGSFLVTVLANVPLNEELARVATDAPADELAHARAAYEEPWNFWNGVRGLFSLAAFVALTGACLLREEHKAR